MSNWVGGTLGAILDPIVGISAFLLFSYITIRWGEAIGLGILKITFLFTIIFCPLFIFAPIALVSPIWLLAPVVLIGGGLLLAA